MQYELGFLGAGNMAEAIARAAVAKGVLRPQQIIASDPSAARREVFAKLGVTAVAENAAVIQQSRQVLVAVKPQMMPAAAGDLAQHLTGAQVVISIMAGVSTAKLADRIAPPPRPAEKTPRLVRVMPNTPMLVGEGMAAVTCGAGARPGDDEFTLRLFAAGGKVVRVPEALMDAVTAVSGSGPAYVFYLAEAMEHAARDLGLGEHARLLVAQTILGAAHLLVQSPDPAAELRRKVTSPGGTTEAAIRCLDGAKTGDVIVKAIAAAAARSRELGA